MTEKAGWLVIITIMNNMLHRVDTHCLYNSRYEEVNTEIFAGL